MSSEKSKEVRYQSQIHREIGPGCLVEAKGIRHIIRRLLTLETVLALNLETRQEAVLTMDDIMPLYRTDHAPDLASLSDEAWQEAIRRYEAVHELLTTPNKTTGVSQEIAFKHGTTLPTLYRWAKRFRQSWTVSSLVRPTRSDAGIRKLDERQEDVIEHVIIKHYLKRERTSIRSCYRYLKALCKRLGLETPHLNTFRARANQIAPEVRAYRRHGVEEARLFQPIEGSFPEGKTPYDVIQIDHTLIDLILVDDIHRIAIGRPWITLAVDTFSRMVVGWYVSFNTPGTLGTGICIANAVLPKKTLLHQLNIQHPWPCMGRPRVIHADNAKEFHGKTLIQACQEHLITLQYRKLKKPQYGAHIERLLGTLAMEIHGLEGTTFSNTTERGDYNSTGKASMTLSEFEGWLANLILGIYHHSKHEGIGMPPITKFQQGILGDDKQPGVGYIQVISDPEKFRMDFLPLIDRTVQPYGVQLDYIYYYSDVLQSWIGARESGTKSNKRKFLFRRDPRDISTIFFFDPDLKRYFPIPYRNPAHPAITLWELKAIHKYLERQGKDAEDEDIIFASLDEMRRIEDSASSLTQRKKNEQQRLKRRGVAPPTPLTSEPQPLTSAITPGPAPIPESPTPPRRAQLPSADEILPFDEVDDL